MLAVDGIAAAFTWTPYYSWMLVDSYRHSQQQEPDVQDHDHRPLIIIIFTILTIDNCFVTPIIYLICNRDFKVRLLQGTSYKETGHLLGEKLVACGATKYLRLAKILYNCS